MKRTIKVMVTIPIKATARMRLLLTLQMSCGHASARALPRDKRRHSLISLFRVFGVHGDAVYPTYHPVRRSGHPTANNQGCSVRSQDHYILLCHRSG